MTFQSGRSSRELLPAAGPCPESAWPVHIGRTVNCFISRPDSRQTWVIACVEPIGCPRFWQDRLGPLTPEDRTDHLIVLPLHLAASDSIRPPGKKVCSQLSLSDLIFFSLPDHPAVLVLSQSVDFQQMIIISRPIFPIGIGCYFERSFIQ